MASCRGMGVMAMGLMLGVLVFPVRAAAQVEVFEGTLVSTAAGASGIVPFTIQIEKYTTDQETLALIETLADDGWRALESALQDAEESDVGRFQVQGQPRILLGLARNLPNESGRVVRVATARPIRLFDWRSPRSREYAFGIIELILDENGNGSGSVIAAAKVEFDDKGQLSIESYTQPPFSITRVSVRR